MPNTQSSYTFILTLTGSVLIITNGLFIALNATPLTLSSFPVGSVEEVMGAKDFWGRVVFGVPGLVEGLWTLFWLAFAVLMLLSAYAIYLKPRRQKRYAPLIMISSLLCIPIGGGFYLGTILGFLGGASGMEWPKSFKETFFGKMIRAALLNSKLYAKICDDPQTLKNGAYLVLLVSILSGIGNGLYTYNVYLITKGGDSASNILLKGQVIWGDTPLLITSALIGVTVLEWLILSLAIYLVGAKLSGTTSEYDKVARVVAFAYVPVSLQVFLPLMFSNEPALSINWPLGLYLLSRLWVVAALVVATAQMFDFTTMRSLGVVILGGMTYWLIDNLWIIPTLKVPGIQFGLSLAESSLAILLMISTAAVIATLLGVFTRK